MQRGDCGQLAVCGLLPNSKSGSQITYNDYGEFNAIRIAETNKSRS
jgi:hypothetical protein